MVIGTVNSIYSYFNYSVFGTIDLFLLTNDQI